MKRVLEYKLPMWGIWIIAIVALATAYVASIEFFLSFFFNPPIPSDIPRPAGIPITEVMLMVYIAAMAILDLILAVGLFMRWNQARIITIIMAPAPVIGVLLNVTVQTWQLNTIASLLIVTGISFPSLAPLISIYTQVTIPAIILALLNIGTIIYLSNNHIKAHFQRQKPRRIESTGV